jgi:hypothetical protein
LTVVSFIISNLIGMRKGIPIAWQSAGMLLVCLATTLNHPVFAVEETVSMRDTAYYFNELGVQIYCDTLAAKKGNYVIRTCKTQEELYPEWDGRVTKNPDDYKPADVKNITVEEAEEVEKLIRKGRVNDSLVRKNVVPILDKMTLKKILMRIKDSTARDRGGKFKVYGGDGKFREYSGKIRKDSSFTFTVGRVTDPSQPHNEGVYEKVGPLGHFHSHPGGEMTGYIAYNKSMTYSFAQAPSYQDQTSIGDKIGYVFAMRENEETVPTLYVYDKLGVRACLRLDYLLVTTPCH